MRQKSIVLVTLVILLASGIGFSQPAGKAQAAKDRGDAYADKGQYDLAVVEYTRAIEIDPRFAGAYVSRGHSYYKQDKFEPALVDYDKSIQLDPKIAVAYYNRGVVYSRQKKHDKAIAEFTRAVQVDPRFAKAYVNRGAVFHDLDKLDLAFADMQRGLRLDPKDAIAYFNRGLINDARHKYSLAIVDYSAVIRLSPQNASAYERRAADRLRLGKFDLGIADLTKAIELGLRDARMYAARGVAYAELGKVEPALADLDKALELDPRDGNIYYYRGRAYAAANRPYPAIADFTSAIELDAKLGKLPYKYRGEAYNELEKYDLAIADFSKVIELDPSDVSAYVGRGAAYDAQGDHDRAIADYNRAIKLDPKNDIAYAQRAFSLALQEKYEQAIADASTALRLDPRNGFAYAIRAVSYCSMGKKSLAIADERRAIKLGAVLIEKCTPANTPNAVNSSERPDAFHLLPRWKKGEKMRFEIVKTRQKTENGQMTSKGGTRTELEIEVLLASRKGYVVKWSLGETKFDDPKQAELLGKEMMDLTKKGAVIILEIDSDGSITGIQNGQQLMADYVKGAETLIKQMEAKGVGKEEIDGVRKVMSAFTKEQIEAMSTTEAMLFCMALGQEYVLAEPIRYAVELPNPFGEEPFPGQAAYTLKAIDRKSGKATISWTGNIDDKKAGPIMERTIKGFGKLPGKPMPEGPALGSLSMDDTAELFVDITTGWTERLTYTRTIRVTAGSGPDLHTSTREDTTSITRKTP